MKGHTLRFPLTSAAVLVALIVLLASVIGNINIIDVSIGFLDRIERGEIDEIATALLLVVAAFIVDHVLAMRRAQQEIGLQAERLRVVQVTMRTVQDIVNNSLNQLQLVRFEAEDHVPRESLDLFDRAIQETAAKLTALGDLEVYTENQLVAGSGLGAGSTVPL